MRIAFITFEYPPFLIGGAGVYAYNLTKELVRLGNEVVVFTPEFDQTEKEEINGLKIINVKINRRLPLVSVQFWLNLPKILKKVHYERNFDIVHVNGTSYWFIPGKVISVPHVVTIHHLSRDAEGDSLKGIATRFSIVGESSMVYQYLESRCLEFVDSIISVSKYTKDRITEVYNIPDDRITVVYNGYEPIYNEVTNDRINEFKSRFDIDSRPIILFVGRIDDPRKGLEILLDSLSKISMNMDFQLLIVGKGDGKAVQKKAQEFRIGSKITVTGFLKSDDLACSYSICDVYVCPSLMEGFGLTILEAASYGKKIVAFNSGAIPEIAPPDTIIVNHKPIDLAKGIINALNTDILKSKNISHVLKFSWALCAKKTSEVYNQTTIDYY